ncbi:MAG TPA: WbqC family protein [Amycolatopsis sp.]|uniref:WbqC family protein n=1 Tax=Amycolatopsis sp. TaxID=37632 RepID=UPI002B45BA85|nr:WbqC family protein [Amycolatopsis sp.]HKS46542.1 WbqC family protein [Amycolatopsis sp.]
MHQPNFFPRSSTLAKLFRADIWVVLDDVQFNARDYQHRARLAPLSAPDAQEWLTLPVHRPHGRASRIDELRLVDPDRSMKHLDQLVRHRYRRSAHWAGTNACVAKVLAALEVSDRIADVAETSTLALLSALGWPGTVVRSSTLDARCGRSVRLADLTKAVRADTYLCGPGGSKYLDETPFADAGITVSYPPPPAWSREPGTRSLSALWAMAVFGPATLREELAVHDVVRPSPFPAIAGPS